MDPTIANWTPSQLRQFIVNSVLTDPGALPKPRPPGLLPMSGLDTWPMTYFELNSTGYGAAPDTSFRNFVNGSVKTDISNTGSWITDASLGKFTFPRPGSYVVAMGKRLNNAEGGSAALMLLNDPSVGGFVDMLAARSSIPVGTDPSGNVLRSGMTAGPTIFTPTMGHIYRLYGFYNGGNNFSAWLFAMRVPFTKEA